MPIKIKRWIEQSGIDYYISFIKAWIPFNAWYMKEYYDEDLKITTDKAIIDKIKNESNPVKSKIIAMLTAESDESFEFRRRLALLQRSLEQHPLSPDRKLSFDSICISANTQSTSIFTDHTKTYKGVFDNKKKRTDNRFSVEAMRKDGKTIVKIELPDCREETLASHPDFAKCSDTEKRNLLKCLSDIFPKKPISVMCRDSKKGINIYDNIYMVKDTNLIAQALITMLYELRCKLFHGELDPTDSNSEPYCHAYHLLCLILKELK